MPYLMSESSFLPYVWASISWGGDGGRFYVPCSGLCQHQESPSAHAAKVESRELSIPANVPLDATAAYACGG